MYGSCGRILKKKSFSHLTRSILKVEELDNREPPILNNHDGSDNESVCSNDPDITQSFSRLKSEIKQEMTSTATQIEQSFLDINKHIQKQSGL